MRNKNLIKAGSSVALCLGLTAGGYGIASAATSGSTPAASTSPAKPSVSGHGLRKVPQHARDGGVITALGANSITVQRPDGTTKTISITATTKYKQDGVASSASALKVGERIEVRVARAAPSSTGSSSNTSSAGSSTTTAVVAATINIVDPRIAGTVDSISGPTLVISTPAGFYRTVDLSGSTTYTNAGKVATESSVATGDRVVAVGTVDANHTDLDALRVAVNPVRAGTHEGSTSGSASATTTG